MDDRCPHCNLISGPDCGLVVATDSGPRAACAWDTSTDRPIGDCFKCLSLWAAVLTLEPGAYTSYLQHVTAGHVPS